MVKLRDLFVEITGHVSRKLFNPLMISNMPQNQEFAERDQAPSPVVGCLYLLCLSWSILLGKPMI